MTAALANSEPKASPLPASVDAQAEAFKKLEEDLATARLECSALQKEIATKESALVALVSAYGGPHATKSKILHGIVWEMLATFSQYTTQDSAAVERFRLALVEAGQTRLMKKIFRTDVRYTMLASADEIVKTGKLSPTLMKLLLLCTTTQDKKPSLDVRKKKKSA